LQEQLRDKDKQLTNLKDRVKSLQTDSSNTDTALATLEEALSEKVSLMSKAGAQTSEKQLGEESVQIHSIAPGFPCPHTAPSPSFSSDFHVSQGTGHTADIFLKLKNSITFGCLIKHPLTFPLNFGW
jgi:hypothetical protein